jgi:hypothetical protein
MRGNAGLGPSLGEGVGGWDVSSCVLSTVYRFYRIRWNHLP